jgi:hypothetical protein
MNRLLASPSNRIALPSLIEVYAAAQQLRADLSHPLTVELDPTLAASEFEPTLPAEPTWAEIEWEEGSELVPAVRIGGHWYGVEEWYGTGVDDPRGWRLADWAPCPKCGNGSPFDPHGKYVGDAYTVSMDYEIDLRTADQMGTSLVATCDSCGATFPVVMHVGRDLRIAEEEDSDQ